MQAGNKGPPCTVVQELDLDCLRHPHFGRRPRRRPCHAGGAGHSSRARVTSAQRSQAQRCPSSDSNRVPRGAGNSNRVPRGAGSRARRSQLPSRRRRAEGMPATKWWVKRWRQLSREPCGHVALAAGTGLLCIVAVCTVTSFVLWWSQQPGGDLSRFLPGIDRTWISPPSVRNRRSRLPSRA